MYRNPSLWRKCLNSLGLVANCESFDYLNSENSALNQSNNHDNDLPKGTFHVSFYDSSSKNKWDLEFDGNSKNPRWGYELLIRDKSNSPSSSNKDISRKNSKFFTEPSICDIAKVYHKDYNNTGFDRGHMIPAGDFMQSQEALDSTFTMANISPQIPALNKGFWAKVEAYLRLLIIKENFDEVAIVTGPVFAPVYINGKWIRMYNTIGTFPKLITIPTHFFKIVLAKRYLPIKASSSSSSLEYEQVVVAAFLIPNNDSVINESSLKDYIVRVDQLEAVVGLKFFSSSLSDSSRTKVDKVVPSSRDLEIVLNPISNAYSTLLPSVPSTSSPTAGKSSKNSNNNNNNNNNGSNNNSSSGGGSIRQEVGTNHLCRVTDCDIPLSILMNHSHTHK